MKIEKIIHDTTREVLNVEDKLSIATIFLFCEKIGALKLAELLYCDGISYFIQGLQKEYKSYEVDFSIRLDNPNVRAAFYKTIEKYKEKNDSDGFLKAIYNQDPFALVICDIVEYNFDKVEFKKFTQQLTFNF